MRYELLNQKCFGEAFRTLQVKVCGNCWQGKDVQIQILPTRKLVAASHLNSPKCDFACHFSERTVLWESGRIRKFFHEKNGGYKLCIHSFEHNLKSRMPWKFLVQIHSLSILMSSSCSTAFLLTLDIKFLLLLSYKNFVLWSFSISLIFIAKSAEKL